MLCPWSSVGAAGAGCVAGVCGSGGRVSCSAGSLAVGVLALCALDAWANKLTDELSVARSPIASSRVGIEELAGLAGAELGELGAKEAGADPCAPVRLEMSEVMSLDCDERVR